MRGNNVGTVDKKEMMPHSRKKYVDKKGLRFPVSFFTYIDFQ